MKHNQYLKYLHLLILIFFVVTGLVLTACGGLTEAQETHTIGVINYVPVLDVILEGFKAGMAELGYVEGQNVTYIYHGAIKNDPQVIDREIKSLLDQKVNLIVTMGTAPTQAAKKAVEGTDIPVIFAPAFDPIREGIVTNLSHPGGNLTGIQNINDAPKSLEWLFRIMPGTKKVYVFYHPADETSVNFMSPLPDTATQLGVEIIPVEAYSPEEVMAAVRTLPKDAAIFFVPAPSLDAGLSDVKKLAVELGIPTGGQSDPRDNMVFAYAADPFAEGKQASRLADQILKGVKPGDLPVETAESFLTINLKTAQAVGLNIPDDLLRQADTIIR
ncbi:MAG: ABC transporter substrate-binding protein [Anaerolineales bacterium]|nr:ABC transporter substrate-binding protein [Anaerolineales bacterium]